MIQQYPNWLLEIIGLYKPEAYVEKFKRFADELAALGADSRRARQLILNEFPELDETQAEALLGFILEERKNE